jgi:hypothetical protein
MTATDEAQIRARLSEIDERWWGVHTSHDLATGRVGYGSAHRHAGEDIGYLSETVKALLALVKTPAESARLAALAAWDDEQHRFYHDADLVPGSPRWEEQYATEAVLWGRLLRLLEAQREGATDGNG